MSRSNRKSRSSRKRVARQDTKAASTKAGSVSVDPVDASTNTPSQSTASAEVASAEVASAEVASAEVASAEVGHVPTTPADVADVVEAAPAECGSASNANDDMFSHFEAVLKRFDALDGRLNELAEPLALIGRDSVGERERSTHQDSRLLDLQTELENAWRENEELRHQNEHLNAELASSSAQRTVQANIGLDESLSWEERKAMIMAQMEEDSFDAEEFVSSLSPLAKRSSVVDQSPSSDATATDSDSNDLPLEIINPQQFVESMIEQLEDLQAKLKDRDDEIKELQHLLQNQADTRAGGIAIGAAAIAGLVDSDELIIEERERLQQLKNDWEDKFRQSEIDASLERAKLSRERQELAKRAQQLEEQIDDLQREKRGRSDSPSVGRRWMAELGLAGGDKVG